ncbi:hypothetical protein C8R27_10271 [Nitrosomonas ureae]|nr:hypothetical protein C8R27_10271 [Nitrosomonas ureae]
MKDKELNLLDWQKHDGPEEVCAQILPQQHWPEGFASRTAGMNINPLYLGIQLLS